MALERYIWLRKVYGRGPENPGRCLTDPKERPAEEEGSLKRRRRKKIADIKRRVAMGDGSILGYVTWINVGNGNLGL